MGSKEFFALHNISVEIGGLKLKDCTEKVSAGGTGRKVLGVFQNVDKSRLKSMVLLRILRRDSIRKISVSIGRSDGIICNVVMLPDHGESIPGIVFRAHHFSKIRGAAISVDPDHNKQCTHRIQDPCCIFR